jgi:hypothetical protein
MSFRSSRRESEYMPSIGFRVSSTPGSILVCRFHVPVTSGPFGPRPSAQRQYASTRQHTVPTRVGPAFLLPPSARQLSDALQLSSVSCKPRQLLRKLRTFELPASNSTAVTPGRSSSTFPQPPRTRSPLHAPCPSPNLPAARPVAVPWTTPRAHPSSASHTHDARSQDQSCGPQQHLVPSPTTKPPRAASHESPQDPPLRPRASQPSLCSHPPTRAAQQSRPRTPSLARPPCVIPRRTAPAPPRSRISSSVSQIVCAAPLDQPLLLARRGWPRSQSPAPPSHSHRARTDKPHQSEAATTPPHQNVCTRYRPFCRRIFVVPCVFICARTHAVPPVASPSCTASETRM